MRGNLILTAFVSLFTLICASALCASEIPNDLPRRAALSVGMEDIGEGVRLTWVSAGSAEDRAGLQVGDIITTLDNQSVRNSESIAEILKDRREGEQVSLVVSRSGRQHQLNLKLGPMEKLSSPMFDVLYGSVVAGDNTLRRVLVNKPRPGGRLPTIFFIAGFGCYSLDAPFNFLVDPFGLMYNEVIEELTLQGFVVVRVDKSGMGDSQGIDGFEEDFHAEQSNYRAVLAALSQYDFVDPNEISIVGHSMGGIFAPRIAQAQPGTAKNVVGIGSGGGSWYDYERRNARRQWKMEGKSGEELEREMQHKRLAMDLLLIQKKTPEEIRKAYPKLYPKLKKHLSYPKTYRFVQQLADVVIENHWEATAANNIQIYGASDFITSAESHIELCNEIRRRKKPCQYVEIPEMDHSFQRARNQMESFKNPIGKPFHQEGVQRIARMLRP